MPWRVINSVHRCELPSMQRCATSRYYTGTVIECTECEQQWRLSIPLGWVKHGDKPAPTP